MAHFFKNEETPFTLNSTHDSLVVSESDHQKAPQKEKLHAKTDDKKDESFKSTESAYREVILHEEDAGNNFEVKPHGEVVIALKEDSASHCKWVVKNVDADVAHLIEETKEDSDGSDQFRVFRFRVVEGATPIEFSYKNPWIPTAIELKSLDFTVATISQ